MSELINLQTAVQVIRDMAVALGLHVSAAQAETVLSQIEANSSDEQIAKAWSVLFPTYTTNRTRLRTLHASDLPAWVISGGHIGLIRKTPENSGDVLLAVQWAGQPAQETDTSKILVLTPASIKLQQNSVGAEIASDGVATAAIKAAIVAHTPVFGWAAMVSVVMNTMAIGTSLFSMQVYDRVIPNFAEATLWVLTSGVAVVLVLELIFKLIRLKIIEAASIRIDEAVSVYLLEKLMLLKVDRRPSRVGSLVAQFRDYDAVKNFFTSTTLFVLADLPFIILFIGMIALIGGPVALVVVAFVMVSLIVGVAVYRPLARLQREDTDESARRLGLVFEAVAGGEIVKSTASESRFSGLWQKSTRSATSLSSRLRAVNAYATFSLNSAQQAAYILMVVAGVYVIHKGDMTMGGLIACTILGGRALAYISQITQLLIQWHHARYALQVLDSILDRPTDDDDRRQANTGVLPLEYDIRELRYFYGESKTPQIDIPALSIQAGTRLALIGANGSGKSTLLKLLSGIYTPGNGTIALAGIDLQAAKLSWLREVIGYLPQEVRLFSGTLRDNLTLGLGVINEDDVIDAMNRTGLMASISRSPQGLNLVIDESGSGLSGGQRQMVGLTRLLLQRPKVWLLDEPSSSLDKNAEEALIKVIATLPADHTVIFTSHRPAWLALAKRVVMLEAGRVRVDAPASEIKPVNPATLKPEQPQPMKLGAAS